MKAIGPAISSFCVCQAHRFVNIISGQQEVVLLSSFP